MSEELTEEMVKDYLVSKEFNPLLVRIRILDNQVRFYPVTYLGDRFDILKEAIIGFWVPNKKFPMQAHFICYAETLLQRINGEI